MKHTSIQNIESYFLKSVKIDFKETSPMVATSFVKEVNIEGLPPYEKQETTNVPLMVMPVNQEGEPVLLDLLFEMSRFGFVKNETVPTGFRISSMAVMPKGDIKIHYDSQTGSGHKKLNLFRVDGDIKRVKGIEHRILSDEDTRAVLGLLEKMKSHLYDVFIIGKVQELSGFEF